MASLFLTQTHEVVPWLGRIFPWHYSTLWSTNDGGWQWDLDLLHPIANSNP